MPTLYHAHPSRSTGIMQLLHEMAALDRVDVTEVTVRRPDGSGQRDPANPHPEGKVPYLVDGDDHLRERFAITLYLTDRYGDDRIGRPVGHPQRGAYLSWLFWGQGVFETLIFLHLTGVGHPVITAQIGDLENAVGLIDAALAKGPYLLGEDYSAADLTLAGNFARFAGQIPTTKRIEDWAARCHDRDSARAYALPEPPVREAG